ASPAPAFRYKISLDKQKQSPLYFDVRKQCLIKKANISLMLGLAMIDLFLRNLCDEITIKARRLARAAQAGSLHAILPYAIFHSLDSGFS
ncbi:MAG: hypothetical protein ABIH03_02955, partial [Pseudomonadota bacterium]